MGYGPFTHLGSWVTTFTSSVHICRIKIDQTWLCSHLLCQFSIHSRLLRWPPPLWGVSTTEYTRLLLCVLCLRSCGSCALAKLVNALKRRPYNLRPQSLLLDDTKYFHRFCPAAALRIVYSTSYSDLKNFTEINSIERIRKVNKSLYCRGLPPELHRFQCTSSQIIDYGENHVFCYDLRHYILRHIIEEFNPSILSITWI